MEVKSGEIFKRGFGKKKEIWQYHFYYCLKSRDGKINFLKTKMSNGIYIFFNAGWHWMDHTLTKLRR